MVNERLRDYPACRAIILAAMMLLALLATTKAIAGQQAEGWWPGKGMVSLIRLIANGRAYEGKEITTNGIVEYRFEERMLYVGPYDADLHNENNGVWLELGPGLRRQADVLNGRLVMVTGTYHLPERASHGSCPNGALVNVSRIEPWNEAPHWKGTPVSVPPK